MFKRPLSSKAALAVMSAVSAAFVVPTTVRAQVQTGDMLTLKGVPLSDEKGSIGSEATSGAIYSNVDPLSYKGYGYTNGGATAIGTNTTTDMIFDDLNCDSGVGGGLIQQFTIRFTNFGATSVATRLNVRFFSADPTTGAPSTYLTGFTTTNTIAAGFNSGYYFPSFSSIGLNLGTGTHIWAGVSFDNSNGTTSATADQLNNLGQIVYDPPVVGTSADLIYDVAPSTANPTFTAPSPTGAAYNSGTTDFGLSYGYELVGPNVVATTHNWNIDSDGSYTVAGNWTNGLPSGVGSVAVLGTKITAPRTITMDSNQSVSTLTISSPISYTMSGPGSLLVTNGMNVTAGSHTISSLLITGNAGSSSFPLNIAATSTLTATNFDDTVYGLNFTGGGTLNVNRTQAATLTIAAGTMKLIAGGTLVNTNGTLSIAGGPLAPTAKLDVTDNDVIFASGTGTMATGVQTAIQNYVKYARDGGQWDRAGITTSSALPNGQQLSPKSLAVVSATEYMSLNASNTTFDGTAIVPGNILLKFTYNGDADLNGIVNAADYHQIDTGFQNQHNANFAFDWFNGDFDYNGVINSQDYALIDAAYQLQSGTLKPAITYLETGVLPTGAISDSLAEVIAHNEEFGTPYANAFVFANVPEPTTLCVMGLASAGLMARRRRLAK